MESGAKRTGAEGLSPGAREAVRRVREALGKDERENTAPLIRHIIAHVAPNLLRTGEDELKVSKIARKVVAVGDGVCIKLTDFTTELDLLTRLYEADPAHTVRPLFAVLGPNFTMAGYAMERMQTTVHKLASKLDRKAMGALVPEIDRQSLEAVTSYRMRGLEHGDIDADNAGINIGKDGSVSLKYMDPLYCGQNWLSQIPEVMFERDMSMRNRMMGELRAALE
ncbi:MAG: hypothetical protein KGH58_04305 [Candidatus Micrarchaeota archaeon]|nr:hypothetical protein [Candidatus Micrarchaeota archaeon]